MVEILHIINKISVFENPDETSKTIKNIINYINNHFTSDITLDSLCELFFISKYHLCRIFKQSTGLTVQAYIRQKRLLLVSELQKEGKSLNWGNFQNRQHQRTSWTWRVKKWMRREKKRKLNQVVEGNIIHNETDWHHVLTDIIR